jgi:primosomal protein N' (replication factor Y)
MIIAKVLIEHAVDSLDMPFDYVAPNSLQKGVRVKVSFNKRELTGYVVDTVNSNLTLAEYEMENGFKLNSILEIIDEKPILNQELDELAMYLAKETYSPLISCYQTLLPPSLKPSSSKKTKIKTLKAVKINGEYDNTNLTSKQKELYDFIFQNKEVMKKDIKQSLNSLIKQNKIVEFDKEVYRDPYLFAVEKKKDLN